MTELEKKIAYFKTSQEQILEQSRKLQKMTEEYKAELKATFGITDGEQMNVLQLVESFVKIQGIK